MAISHGVLVVAAMGAWHVASAHGCGGASGALYDWECDAWGELFDATGGENWTHCSKLRDDPCSCDGGEGDVCAPGLGQHDMKFGVCCQGVQETGFGITRIVLHGANMTGELPDNLDKFGALAVFDVDHNQLRGKIPQKLPAKLGAFYVGGFTNQLTGPLPAELPSELAYFDVDGQTYGHSTFDDAVPAAWATGFAELLDLKLKYTGLTGVLPDLNFTRMKDCGMRSCCNLTGNDFECPLPPGAAEFCNATCTKTPLRHVVLGKWTGDSAAADRAAALKCLEELPGEVPEIESYVVGADMAVTAANFDFGIVGEFASVADFEAYEASAAHQACLAVLEPVLAEKAAVEMKL